MDRRDFIRALAGGLVIARTIVEAQPAAKVWTIDYLAVGAPGSRPDPVLSKNSSYDITPLCGSRS
jgi:hypothetical protein